MDLYLLLILKKRLLIKESLCDYSNSMEEKNIGYGLYKFFCEVFLMEMAICNWKNFSIYN